MTTALPDVIIYSMSEVATPRSLPDMIGVVREQGGLIHDLPAQATAQLAARYGIYTTTEPRDPGNFREFSRNFEREEAFATIAQRVGSMLSKTEQYKEAVVEGVLGGHLTAAFGSISRIACEDVHLAATDVVPKDQKGIVTATKTVLTVPTAEHANAVSVAVQALLATGSHETFYPVTTGIHEDTATVHIANLDEHAARSLSRDVEAVVAHDDKRLYGVVLPPTKRPYQVWKEQGETFPPAVERRLRKALADYQQLEISGTYRDRADLQPVPKPRIIGNDSAAFFEGIRDIFNGLIHDVRAGGSHLNLEQHPIKAARPLVEAGIELKRPKSTLEDVATGPMSAQGLGLTDRGMEKGRTRLEDVRKHPVRAFAKGVSSALSLPGTVLDAAGSAIKYLPAGAEAGKNLTSDYQEWRARKERAAEGGKRLDELAHRLGRLQNGLIIWE